MECTNCGSDVPAGKKFCTNCGTSLGEPTTTIDQVPSAEGTPPQVQLTTPMPPVQPIAAAVPPVGAPAPKSGKKAAVILVVAALVALLVVGGVVGAIIIVSVINGNKLVADITKVELKRSDNKSLNLKDVPLDTDLSLEITYNARFKQGGRGTLDTTLVDGKGAEVRSKSYSVKSSGASQTKTEEYSMTMSEGETFKATAALRVSKGDKKQSDEESIEYYVAAGKGEEMQFSEAKDGAIKKLEDATNAVKEIVALGIDGTDLANQLLDATGKLKEATTVAQANGIAGTADAVIAECANRKAARQAAGQAIDTCRANQAKVRQLIISYYNANGNLPNSMSDLAGLPSCPSGGHYTYNAPSTDPSTLSVSCSVHGSL
jgi:zinc-ribbon domain